MRMTILGNGTLLALIAKKYLSLKLKRALIIGQPQRSNPMTESTLKIGDIIKAKFTPAFDDEVEIIGRVREFKGEMICCNEINSESPFFCFEHEAVKINLPEAVVKSLGEVS